MSLTWFNGKLLPENSVILPSLVHPWLRADALFETVRTEGSTVFFLFRHLARLQKSAVALLFPNVDLERIQSACDEVMRASASEIDQIDQIGRLRILLFSNEDLLITHQKYEELSGEFNLGFYPGVRYSNSDLGQIKSISYLGSATALRWAKRNGFEDCLFKNEKNNIVESALANVLIEKEGRFYTPPLASGCLPGIVREVLLQTTSEITEMDLTFEDVATSAVALISSLREVSIISHVNGVLTSPSVKLLELRSNLRNLARSTPDF